MIEKEFRRIVVRALALLIGICYSTLMVGTGSVPNPMFTLTIRQLDDDIKKFLSDQEKPEIPS